MRERAQRIEALGLTTAELTTRIGITEADLGRWIAGSLSVEEADVIEVGLAMLEIRRRRAEAVTMPLPAITAA